MVKLKQFFLSLTFSFWSLSIIAQDKVDTLLIKKSKEIFNRCWAQERYHWLDSQFYSCFDSAIALYPSYYYYHIKGMPAVKVADYSRFVRNLEIACEKNPEHNGYFGYVTLYHLIDYHLALKRLRMFDALTPKKGDIVMNDNILSVYGLCFSEMGELDSALYYFNYLIDTGHDGNYKFYATLYDYTNRGIIHLKKGNLELAKKDFEKTIQEYSQSVEGHYFLALVKFKMGEPSQNIEPLLKKALNYYDRGLKNNHPYGEYVDLPNEVWRSDIMDLYYKIKGINTFH